MIPFAIRSMVRELERSLRNCSTILEVGCGGNSPLQHLAKRRAVDGLDIHEPELKRAKEKGLLANYHLGDALEIDDLFERSSFDAVVALDVIEHLEREDGLRLIEKMKFVAAKRIVINTPNGFIPQHDTHNPWNCHRSGWTTTDFSQMGFSVVGMYGWKGFRGEWGKLKHRPKLFFGALSELSHILWTRKHPESAFSLFCSCSFGGGKSH